MTTTRQRITWLPLAPLFMISAVLPSITMAADTEISTAKADDIVGEQSNGYLGFNKTPSASLKTAVEAINIKRRAVYTQTATARNVTVEQAAAAVGCQTLANRVTKGQVYRMPDGTWHTKSDAPIALPDYCGQ